MKVRYFLIIIILTCVYGALVRFIPNAVSAEEQTKVESTELVQCTNPEGCIQKLDPKLPVCPVCQFPVSTYSATPSGDNIAQEIVNVLEEARLLNEKIIEIKAERERNLQERLANRKSYDLEYAKKVLRNAKTFRDAKARKLAHIKSGKEDVEGSLPSGIYRGQLKWAKEKDFILYPKVRPK